MEKEKLKEIKIDYLDKINISDNNFGIEIEFAGASFKKVDSKLNQLLGYKYINENIKQLELEKENYKKWKLVNDSTVQENDYYAEKKGGEINSPKMKNKKRYWQELKQVCEMLRSREYINISDSCAIHIHTDMNIYKEVEEYKNLLKLWILYEDIIYRFGYGEKDTPRKTILNFAKPFSFEYNLPPETILQKLEKIETLKELIRLLRYERKYGLNLTNIIKKEVPPEEIRKNMIRTIEIRIYNGTLNENIIQNNVRFNMNLLDYAKIENFDQEFINYKIKNYKPLYINDSVKENIEKAEEFSKLIFKDELGRLKFLKQYYKIYNENDIEKSIHL